MNYNMGQFVGVPFGLPQTPPVKVNFYNPFTMQVNRSVNVYQRVTKAYNCSGKVVEITGDNDIVDEVLNRLNNMSPISSVSSSPVSPTNSNSQNGQFFPIGTPLQVMQQNNRPNQQVQLNLPGLQPQQSGLIGQPANIGFGYRPIMLGFQHLSTQFVLPGIQLVNNVGSMPIGTVAQEWQFVTNQINSNIPLLKHPTLPIPFSGSGIMFFEKSYNGNPTVILVKNKSGLFHDMGGRISTRLMPSPNTVDHNARKEALEESQGLFAIEKVTGLDAFVDIPDNANNANYRCYLVALNGTENYPLDQWYTNNKNILDRVPNLPDSWRETAELKRFYLKDVTGAIKTMRTGTNIVCNDTNGSPSTLRDRTVNVIKALTDTLMIRVMQNPAQTRYTQDKTIGSDTFGVVRITI